MTETVTTVPVGVAETCNVSNVNDGTEFRGNSMILELGGGQ